MICVALLAALGLAVAAPIHYNTVADEDVLSLSTTSLDSAFDAVNSSEISAAQLDHLPGVDTYMQQGYNVLPGTPEGAFVRARIFDFDFDYATTVCGVGDCKRYAIPALVSIDPHNKCDLGLIAESEVTTSFESTLTTQASNFQGGYEDSSDVDVGIEYGAANLGVSKTITNTVMFGNSKASSEYKDRSQYRETKTFSAQTTGQSYSMNLDYDAVVEADFNAVFVTAVKELGAAPSFVDALDFYDRFGTHVLQRATLGGFQQRSAYYSADATSETLESATTQTTDSSVNLFGFGIGSSQTEHSASYMYDTNDVRFWRTSREIYGGNGNAETQGEYCKSILDMSSPVVVGRTLYPVFDLVKKIDGVSDSTAEKLKEHLAAIFDPMDSEGNGLRCEWDQDAVCTWDNAMRRHDCRACVCTVEEGAGDYHVEDPCRKRVRYGASFNMATQDQAGPFWLTGARERPGNSNIGDHAYTQDIYSKAPALVGDGYCDERRESTKSEGFTFTSCAERCVTTHWCRSFMFQDDSTGYCILSDSVDCASRTTNRFPWKSYKRGNPWSGTADSYKWIIRSQPGNGDLSYEDPRASEGCVKYGDRVYLQVMSAERRWLSGGSSSGGGSTDWRVRVYDMLARGEGTQQLGNPNYQWIVRSSLPLLCWEAAPAGSSWCGLSHPGQAEYTLESGAAYGDNWRRTSNGWRFCGLTLEACKAACIGMGGCRELNVVSSNGCCFPARSVCDGDERPDDTKLVASTCTEAPPLVDPRQGQCVSLNDKVYLQVNNRWLTGGLGARRALPETEIEEVQDNSGVRQVSIGLDGTIGLGAGGRSECVLTTCDDSAQCCGRGEVMFGACACTSGYAGAKCDYDCMGGLGSGNEDVWTRDSPTRWTITRAIL